MTDEHGSTGTTSWYQHELAAEREYIAKLYSRLDTLREEKQRQLARVQAQGLQGSLQNQSERDSFATLYRDRINQLNAVDERLVFGRLDTINAVTRHIGRIGLADDDRSRLLVDWRAPEAAPFYQATAAYPQGVARRRHIMMSGRTVESFEDDVLTSDDEEHASQALLSAVSAPRTGVMGDIVATIQREQDEIIRDDMRGVLVVQGGPGTGKTAVALHRAAYLLYTHRDRLAKSGVLLVGPSEAFMNYIDQVLPSLGETGVVMSSIGNIYPGVHGVPEVSSDAAEIKGRAEMAEVIANAVSLRQRSIPETTYVHVEGTRLRVRPAQIRRAIKHARESGRPHNQAREVFVDHMVKTLYDQLRDIVSPKRDDGLVNKADRSYLRQEIRQSVEVRRLLNLCWMPLTPTGLINQLLSTPQYLVDAAPMLTAREIKSLLRQPGAQFTEADVPLLDEAAVALGDSSSLASGSSGERSKQRNLDTAEAALENMHYTLEDIGVDGVVTAEMLAAAQEPEAIWKSVADRARSDRTWTYGHIIVDEAQELTHMQWRMLFRRSPLRSFTVVGDLAQASGAAAKSDWPSVLAPFAGGNWRQSELTVNYRTPARIAEAAAEVATQAGRPVTTPQALRQGDYEPELVVTTPQHCPNQILDTVQKQLGRIQGGLVGVIAPIPEHDMVHEVLDHAYPGRVWRGIGRRRDRDLVLVSPQQAKGLEYDAVIIVEPQDIVSGAGGSVGDLYVAMTRATQTLTLITTATVEQLPLGLQDI
ncbi:AAA family ATPase [Enteractinococcus fodinae]|uniref:DNA helicase IV n=1 Tax=Enteractinococcus fodinae TaxID=684663 RepID=A0ABU2B184_9MICC|nr:AAA family ATPase [Enteractinococcus fodinae]MDR7347368.1 DNA helicase IV [Enteractinococcus fodinae]